MTLLPFMSTPPSSSQTLNQSRGKDQLTRNYSSDTDRVGQFVEINVRKKRLTNPFLRDNYLAFWKAADCLLDRRYFTGDYVNKCIMCTNPDCN